MATLAQIKSPVWTYGIAGGGAIVEGLAAIRQCIDIIIRTTLGSDPMRPLFGSDVYKYVDYPVDDAVPNIKAAIIDAISTWENRVTITKVTHYIDLSTLYLEVTYTLTDSTLSDLITVSISNGGVSTGVTPKRLILQGLFPPNPGSYMYVVTCLLNGEQILPVAPDNGFASVNDLFVWIKSNWLNYGQWYVNNDGIVGYMNSEYTSGSLTISLVSLIQIVAGIPALLIGNSYSISVSDNGVLSGTGGLFTTADILQWAQDNLNHLGTWRLLNNPGSFSDDFNDDFDVFNQSLALFTDEENTVIININTQAE